MTTMTREPGEIARQLVYIGGCIRMKFFIFTFVFLQWYRNVKEILHYLLSRRLSVLIIVMAIATRRRKETKGLIPHDVPF